MLLQHCNDSGHPLPEVINDNIEIIDTESDVIKRRIIESLSGKGTGQT